MSNGRSQPVVGIQTKPERACFNNRLYANHPSSLDYRLVLLFVADRHLVKFFKSIHVCQRPLAGAVYLESQFLNDL